MQIIKVTETAYQCDYCHTIQKSQSWMETHEAAHRRVSELMINERVRYNFDQGYIRDGRIIKTDVKAIRLLIEADNGERDWIGLEGLR